jgi:hypothetical protein
MRVRRSERADFELLVAYIEQNVAEPERAAVREAALVLCEFQSVAYARKLVDHVLDVVKSEQLAASRRGGAQAPSVVATVARGLATIMAYPDLAWAAHVKSRRDRLPLLRRRHGIARTTDYEVRDYLPVDAYERAHAAASGLIGRRRARGSDASILPGPLSAPVRTELVKPGSLRGALRLRRLRGLARGRASSPRHAAELDVAATYVLAVRESLEADAVLGVLVAESGAIVNGFGAVRAAQMATAMTLWGRVVRQALAVDRAAGSTNFAFARIVVPFIYDQLCVSGPLALWEHAGRVLGIALHCSRGGTYADAIRFAVALVEDIGAAGA